MKFVAKNSNLRIILEPGLAAQPISGMPAKPTIFVKFTDGIADVRDEELVKKMINHSGFQTDFIAIDEKGEDPYAYNRQEIEPTHFITELKYGTPQGTVSSAKKNVMSPELAKLINAQAMEMVKKMLPDAVESVLRGYQQQKEGVEPVVEPTIDEQVEAIKNTPETPEVVEESEEMTPVKKGVLDFLKSK